MDNEKVLELVDRIEATFRDLAAVTGEDHISSFILNGHFFLQSSPNDKGQSLLHFYREGGSNIEEFTEGTRESI